MSRLHSTALEEVEGKGEKERKGGRETADSDGIPCDLNQMRLCVGSECQSTGNPTPCSDAIGLLSLPWEMVTRIASHLPAQCIINVLPQVCRVLGEVGEDASAWQQRAQRLVGPRASFPAGPRDEVNWGSACLEMEQLLSLWSHMEERRGGGGEENVPDGQEVARGEEEAQAGEDRRGVDEEEERGEEEQVQRLPGDGGEGVQGAGEERREQEAQRGAEEEEVDACVESDSAPSLERFCLPAGHIADVHSVLLFGGQGSLCATGSRDRNVNLWDLQGSGSGSEGSQGRLLQTLGGLGGAGAHSGWVWCLAERWGLLASGAFDSTVRLWDLGANGAPRGVIKGRAPVICLSWQPDALLAGSHDKKISVYDHRASQPLVKTLQLHSSAVLSLVADERYIISGGKDNTIALYDRRAAKLLNKLTVHLPSAPPRTLCTMHNPTPVNGLSVEAGVLAVASGNMAVEVWRPPQ